MYDRNRRSTDQSEAQALRFQRDTVDIYSNSWGPGDMGWRVQGPGPLLKEVLRSGTQWVSFINHLRFLNTSPYPFVNHNFILSENYVARSVGRAPVCCAGGHGFKPRPDQHSRFK